MTLHKIIHILRFVMYFVTLVYFSYQTYESAQRKEIGLMFCSVFLASLSLLLIIGYLTPRCRICERQDPPIGPPT